MQALSAVLPSVGTVIEADSLPVDPRVAATLSSGPTKTCAPDIKGANRDNSEILKDVPVQKVFESAEPARISQDDATEYVVICKPEEIDATVSSVTENNQAPTENGGGPLKAGQAKANETKSSNVTGDIGLHNHFVQDKGGLLMTVVDTRQAQTTPAPAIESAAAESHTSRGQHLKPLASNVIETNAAGPSSLPAENELPPGPGFRKSDSVSLPDPGVVPRNPANTSTQKGTTDEKIKDQHANTNAGVPPVAVPPQPAAQMVPDLASSPVLGRSSSATIPERPGDPISNPMPHDHNGMPAVADDRTSAPVTSAVHDVRLLDHGGEAEMHIGLRTAVFGGVEVHAVVRESQVGLAIGSEKGDLHRFFANEVPGIAGRLQQHDLQLDTVKFVDQGPTFDAGTASGSNPRPRTFSQDRLPLREAEPATELAVVASEQETLIESRSGINVRA